MRKSRFTEEQILYAVSQAEAGVSVPDLLAASLAMTQLAQTRVP